MGLLIMLLLLFTFYTIYAQPCATPAILIGSTVSNGVCTPPGEYKK